MLTEAELKFSMNKTLELLLQDPRMKTSGVVVFDSINNKHWIAENFVTFAMGHVLKSTPSFVVGNAFKDVIENNKHDNEFTLLRAVEMQQSLQMLIDGLEKGHTFKCGIALSLLVSIYLIIHTLDMPVLDAVPVFLQHCSGYKSLEGVENPTEEQAEEVQAFNQEITNKLDAALEKLNNSYIDYKIKLKAALEEKQTQETRARELAFQKALNESQGAKDGSQHSVN